ncbi:MAG: 50S ribosomal protein L7/L12 [candidate division WWE3 bacterium GW2011_GWD1_43_201]|nr:MAG: 50S ribosomal protein L7/L12 [candidate division WWE3 bacterium GW2011_GWD1_43_201]
MADEKDIKLSGDAQKVMDIVEKMTVLELNDLVKALEEKFGVTAAAPMMMGAMMPAAGNGGEPAEPVEEKTEFDVVLTEAGANKISVIKSVREINPKKLELKLS